MRKVSKLAATFAAGGLAVFGAAVATGGVANAADFQSLAGCSLGTTGISATLGPTCTSAPATVDNPTSVTISVPASIWTDISAAPIVGPVLATTLGVDVTYTLTCVVNGAPVPYNGSFTATDTGTQSQTVDLQAEFGSPEPNTCVLSGLTATATEAFGTVLGFLADDFTFGVTATAATSLPGTIWAQYPSDSSGAGATVCVDDTRNLNAGTTTESFQCENDLAEQWVQVPTGQFVHNGDCLTDTNGVVTIAACVPDPANETGQVWVTRNVGSSGAELTNADGAGCLTAVPTGLIDGTPLRVQTCVSGAVGQTWKIPGVQDLT